MRQTELKRKTPLRANPDQVRAWKQRSRQELERTPLVARVSPRKRAARRALDKITPKLLQRSGGNCEVRIPGVCEGRATNRHHRQGEGVQGASTVENVLMVCGMGNATGCHGYISTERDEAYEMGWLVRSHNDPAKVPYMRWTGTRWSIEYTRCEYPDE